MKIVTVIGARPQFIKAAVVSRAFEQHKQVNEVIIHTGQHFDANMSEVFFQEMHIPKPNYYLGVGGMSHGAMTGRMLEKIEDILLSEKPDIALVYGDTNSTLAGALAAAKLKIPVAHVEAGLRSYNRAMPEEINRILTDRISQWLFCPTETAVANLTQEGVATANKGKNHCEIVVENVGDVMYDAALFYSSIAKASPFIEKMLATTKKYYLATLHRAENTEDTTRLSEISRALDSIAQHTPIIMPLHPRTQQILSKCGYEFKHVTIMEPVGYFDMITLIKGSSAVITDSGGLQKEAYFFSKPCITLRDETEWVELVAGGFNVLTGASRENILKAEHGISCKVITAASRLYGDGNAGKKICQSLLVWS